MSIQCCQIQTSVLVGGVRVGLGGGASVLGILGRILQKHMHQYMSYFSLSIVIYYLDTIDFYHMILRLTFSSRKSGRYGPLVSLILRNSCCLLIVLFYFFKNNFSGRFKLIAPLNSSLFPPSEPTSFVYRFLLSRVVLPNREWSFLYSCPVSLNVMVILSLSLSLYHPPRIPHDH